MKRCEWFLFFFPPRRPIIYKEQVLCHVQYVEMMHIFYELAINFNFFTASTIIV